MKLRVRIDGALAEYRHAKANVKEERQALAKAKSEVKDIEQAQKILQQVAQSVQQSAHEQISHVVTRCLKAIFGDDAYEFAIRFEQKRGKTEARLVFIRDGVEFDPTYDIGDGVLEVASFALRLSALLLNRPPLRRLIILDEPFKNIRGKKYRERIRDLVVQLAEELDFQFIINIDVDAYPEFELERVIELQ